MAQPVCENDVMDNSMGEMVKFLSTSGKGEMAVVFLRIFGSEIARVEGGRPTKTRWGYYTEREAYFQGYYSLFVRLVRACDLQGLVLNALGRGVLVRRFRGSASNHERARACTLHSCTVFAVRCLSRVAEATASFPPTPRRVTFPPCQRDFAIFC